MVGTEVLNMEKGKSAEQLAKEQREVSVSEFFERNRHLLGYDNPTKALLTVIKELVDNSLDSAEDHRVLPRIWVVAKPKGVDRFKIMVKDNGPGMVDKQIPLAFGKLLYGSRFYKLMMTRGQQGLGASGAILYSQLTTGKPTTIISSTGDGKTSFYELMIDIKTNEPEIISHQVINDGKIWHGLKIEMEIEGKYIRGERSVLEYLKETAIANPYADITFQGPDGKIEFKRGANKLPKLPKEIKPHPYGIELGILKRMLNMTRAKTLLSFLTNDFSRVGKTSAKQICKVSGLNPNLDPHKIENHEAEKLFRAMKKVKLLRPPTDCLSPLGEDLLLKGLQKEINAEFFAAVTRPPAVYRGNPFQVECGIAYGGEIAPEGSVKIMRFSNKVPLLYQSGDCAITKAVATTDWSRYGLKQSKNSVPVGPAIILVHFASVWVPFISESKQALAAYPAIMKEIKLALQELGRKLSHYLAGKRRREYHIKRKKIFERYIPVVAESLSHMTKVNEEKIKLKLEKIAEEKTGVVNEQGDSEEINQSSTQNSE